MFCPNCGTKLIDSANFCAACGKKTNQELPTNTSGDNTIAPNAAPILTVQLERQSAPASDRQALLRQMLGKNADYYLEAFARVGRGEKTKFMWSALLLSTFFLFYRNCISLFLKYLLPPMATMIVAYIGFIFGLLTGSIGLMGVAWVAMAGSRIWSLVTNIRMALKFPERYYQHLNLLIDNNRLLSPEISAQAKYACLKKHTGTTLIKPTILVSLWLVLFVIGMIVDNMTAPETEDDVSAWLSEYTATADDWFDAPPANYPLEATSTQVQETATTVNASALKETQYFIQYTEFASPGYEPSLALYADGAFEFNINYSSGVGAYYGSYTLDDGYIQLLPTAQENAIEFRHDGDTVQYLGGGDISITEEGDVFYKATKAQYDNLTYFSDPVELTQDEVFLSVRAMILDDLYPNEEFTIETQEYSDRFVFGVWLKYPPVGVTSSLCGWYAVDKITGDLYDEITGNRL